MKAHLEATGYLIRIFECDDYGIGDVYCLSLVGIPISHDAIRVKGLDKKMTIPIWRALIKALNEAGFEKMVVERYRKNGELKVRYYSTKERVNG